MSHKIIELYESDKIKNSKNTDFLKNLKIGEVLQISHQTKNNKKQLFIGICIAIHNKGLSSSILLRNYIAGEAIEYRLYIYSNTINEIKKLKQNKPQIKYRRSKLYYLRNRTPKESTVA